MQKSHKQSSITRCIPKWIWGYLLANIISGSSFYAMGIAANYTTMWYVNDGYDPITKEWNPRSPLDDRLLPSPEWLDNHLDWILDKPFRLDYCKLRDTPFAIISLTGVILPVVFGRLDIVLNCALIQAFLCGFKVLINGTWQTPPAQGKRLAVHEMGGAETVHVWREASKSDGCLYWTKLFEGGSQHAADMVYSGHTFNGLNLIRASLWVLSEVEIPGQKCLYWTYLVTSILAFLLGMVIMQITRGHYSFDVILATVLWYFVSQWVWLNRLNKRMTNYFTDNGACPAPSVESCFTKKRKAKSALDHEV